MQLYVQVRFEEFFFIFKKTFFGILSLITVVSFRAKEAAGQLFSSNFLFVDEIVKKGILSEIFVNIISFIGNFFK